MPTESLDGCLDRNGSSTLLKKIAKVSAKPPNGTHLKIRIITEITNENLVDCNDVIDFVELRHLEGISGNFTISDRAEIRVYAVAKNESIMNQILYSTVRPFVDQHQYIFDELWKKAIPAKHRIVQLGEGVEPEITQILTGWESIFKDAIERFRITEDRVDSCCDALVPPIIINSPMHQASSDFVKRGGKVRLITEITKENLGAVKILLETQEIRHMNGFKLNFGVTRNSFIAPTSVYSISSEPQCITSTSRDLVDQHQYLFDELWNNATPARIRISQLEEGIEPEVTEIVTGWARVIQKTMEGFVKAKKKVDHCCDALIPPRMVGSDAFKTIVEFASRGGHIRMITEITDENITAIKELMKTQDIRHINGFKLNFGVSEGLFSAPTSVYSVSSEPQCIWSNSRGLVSQHQYLFDGLWSIAVPADIRIREIEQGIAHDVIESISDPDRIQQLALKLVESANKELLIIFSSTNAFILQQHAGLIALLEKYASEKKATVKVITPVDESNSHIVKRWSESGVTHITSKIAVRTTEVSMQSMLSIIVADRSYSLAVEFRERTADFPHGTIGLATYSNSKPTVLSYVTVFEGMWRQAELNFEIRRLYDQLKIQDQQRKEFMDIAAHEFRNPLQPILLLTEVLKRHATDTLSGELLEVIIRNAKRLQQLQENILDVAKIERQLLSIHKQCFNLSELVQEISADFRSQYGDSIRLSIITVSELPILGDRNRLAQVISNLMNNAMKFTKQGTIEMRCEKMEDSQALLSIVDSGIGIDPEIFPKLFTKFATKSSGGTGLGLFISKAIVEAHGGRIWAKNNEQKPGATFSIALPLLERQRLSA